MVCYSQCRVLAFQRSRHVEAVSHQPSATGISQSGSQSKLADSTSEIASSDDGWEWRGPLKDGKPHSPWEDLSPLQADAGITALAGQVLDLNGNPLANVTLEIEYGSQSISAQSDETGRFLLTNISPGRRE